MAESLEDRFQNLHEFVTQARTNLNRNNWDYLIGGAETETTLARNRAALDSWGSVPECCATYRMSTAAARSLAKSCASRCCVLLSAGSRCSSRAGAPRSPRRHA